MASIVVNRGGYFNTGSGDTLTFDVPFFAGPYQIFEGSGVIRFLDGSITAAIPEWWGAKGDGSTNDSTAVEKGLASYSVLMFLNRTYLVNTPIEVDSNKTIYLNGATIKKKFGSGSDNGAMFRIKGKANSRTSGGRVRNVSILGPGTIDGNQQGGGSAAILIEDAERVWVRDIRIRGNDGFSWGVAAGTDFFPVQDVYTDNIKADSTGNYGLVVYGQVHLDTTKRVFVSNFESSYNDLDGIQVAGAFDCVFTNIITHDNTLDGISFKTLSSDSGVFDIKNITVSNVVSYQNRHGFFIGTDDTNGDANNFTVSNIISHNNSNVGILIGDNGASGNGDTNYIQLTNSQAYSNAGDGIHLQAGTSHATKHFTLSNLISYNNTGDDLDLSSTRVDSGYISNSRFDDVIVNLGGADVFLNGIYFNGNYHQILGAAGAGGKAKLSTSELTVVDGDVIGSIEANAPLESSGTDSRLVGAAIDFEAEATYATDNNRTAIVFRTANTETATEKMRLTFQGLLGIGTTTPGVALTVVTNDTMDYGGFQTAAFAAGRDAFWFDPGGDTLFVKNNGTVRFILTTAYSGSGH